MAGGSATEDRILNRGAALTGGEEVLPHGFPDPPEYPPRYPGGNPVGWQTLAMDAVAGSRDPATSQLGPGDEVELSYGGGTFTPVKFCSFEAARVTARTRVREGETGAQAGARLLAFVRSMSDELYGEQLKLFLARVEESAREADRAAERSRNR